jgi:hypothetical protein
MNRGQAYVSNDDAAVAIGNGNPNVYWKAMTFTNLIPYRIGAVTLLIYRLGSPGTLTVSIRATDVNGRPTGGDLCVGTTNGNTLPTASPFEWRTITFTSAASLLGFTKYAIVCRTSVTTLATYVGWRGDFSSPTYDGGNGCYSGDSGSTWADYTGDLMFETLYAGSLLGINF